MCLSAATSLYCLTAGGVYCRSLVFVCFHRSALCTVWHNSALDEHDHVCRPTLEHHFTSTKTATSKTFSVENEYIGSTNLFNIEVLQRSYNVYRRFLEDREGKGLSSLV